MKEGSLPSSLSSGEERDWGIKVQGQLVSTWLLLAASHLSGTCVPLHYCPWAFAANFCGERVGTNCPKEVEERQEHNLKLRSILTPLQPAALNCSHHTHQSKMAFAPRPQCIVSSGLISPSWQEPGNRFNSSWKPWTLHSRYSWSSSKFPLVSSLPLPQSHFSLHFFPLNQS